MNRLTVALLAALEALIVVAIGVGIALVPLTLLWAVQYGFEVDWMLFWRAAADIWLLGNGVNLRIVLDSATVAGLGVPAAAEPFFVTIAPLGFALVSVLMGVRTGLRAGRTRFWLTGIITGFVVYALLAGLVTLSALNAVARPSIVQGFTIPALVFGLGLVIGAITARARRDDDADEPVIGWFVALRDRLEPHQEAIIVAALRGGTAVAASVIAVSAVAVTVMIFANFGTIVSLYESSQLGVVGGIATTIGQIAFIPNFVVWTASWFTGSGFALGTGTSVSPVDTLIGPIPGIPIFGALPSGGLEFGFVGLLVPVLLGFLGAFVTRAQVVEELDGRSAIGGLSLAAVGIGAVSAIELGLLAWWSSGAGGPARFVELGPNPWLVTLYTFVVVTIAALVGMASGSSTSNTAPAQRVVRRSR